MRTTFHPACALLHQILPLLLAGAINLPATPAHSQIVGKRIETPKSARLKTLSIRESTLSSIVTKASATYRKEAGSQSFLLESSEGEPVVEWKIGGEVHPLPEGAPAPARIVEKRVKLIPHEDKVFLKIETLAKGAPERVEEEVRFSGTYEATVLEGSLQDDQNGGKRKVRIAAADHERYLKDVQKAFFSATMLDKHGESFRKQLTGLLEQKVVDPGTSPASEIEMARVLLGIVKAHPETFVVTVIPSFESDPEIFEIEGELMRSTTETQKTTLRFDAKLPAVMRGATLGKGVQPLW
jgi:hypothetical protein